MNEKTFQTTVIDLAAAGRWMHYHTFDSRRSTPGFPDLVLVRPPELLFVELKTDRGVLSPHQHSWIDALREVTAAVVANVGVAAAGVSCPRVEVHVWRPADLDDIERRLLHARSLHETRTLDHQEPAA
jgi:type IV secretory pathway protease TraF